MDKLLVIVKPGFVELVPTIIEKLSTDFKIYQHRIKHLTIDESRALYDVHEGKDFYDDLCEYMSSGESYAMLVGFKNRYVYDFKKHKFVFLYDDRELIDEITSIKEDIRSEYGVDNMRNVMHSSDSITRSDIESSIYFG